jgi:DNA-binding MarR family transcriptional regulator
LSNEASNQTSSKSAARWVALAQRMLACARVFRDELASHAAEWHVNEQEFLLLWSCREAPPDGVSQTELAERLAVSPAQVSGLVERLRCGRLLESRRAECDRRRQLWRLTPAGQVVLGDCLSDLVAWAESLDRRLGSDTVRVLCRWLDQLVSSGLPSADVPQRGAA